MFCNTKHTSTGWSLRPPLNISRVTDMTLAMRSSDIISLRAYGGWEVCLSSFIVHKGNLEIIIKKILPFSYKLGQT